jgi:transmembrane protein
MRAPTNSSRDETPAIVVRWLDNTTTLLFARVCLASPYFVAGVFKLSAWEAGVAEMAHVGLSPAWAFNLASLVVEIGGSLLVIFNWMAWLGAGVLGVFTLIATLLAHRFWELDGAARVSQLNTFLEHAAICAAFILVTVVVSRAEGRASTNSETEPRRFNRAA